MNAACWVGCDMKPLRMRIFTKLIVHSADFVHFECIKAAPHGVGQMSHFLRITKKKPQLDRNDSERSSRNLILWWTRRISSMQKRIPLTETIIFNPHTHRTWYSDHHCDSFLSGPAYPTWHETKPHDVMIPSFCRKAHLHSTVSSSLFKTEITVLYVST